ncbi:MAG: hypothetical protein CXZ00_08735 [Acidobacteria bacterium]|nr:MAG: hypothetical protein CXZ00_08735 [Acidobacteriota bacterium]
MDLMQVIDPVAFEEWISRRFAGDGALNGLNGGSESITLQRLMANAVTDPQVTILSRAVAETGVDETHARMTIALMQAFLQTSASAH